MNQKDGQAYAAGSESKEVPQAQGIETREVREPAVGDKSYHQPANTVRGVQHYSLRLPSPASLLGWVDKIAVLAHEANRIWCLLHGDESQPSWADAPDWQKESAREGIAKIANGEVTSPEQSHESWSQHKLAAGWRYGPTKNPDTKEHPCLVPYLVLPAEQRAKDAIYFGIVQGLVDQYRASGQLGAGVEPR
jgi:hypothetical protein